MNLPVFLCDEVVPVIRVLILNPGSNAYARKRIVDNFAFKHYGNLLNLLKLYRSNHMLPISIIHIPLLEVHEGEKWQTD